MSSLPHSEDPRFGKELRRLDDFHQFISAVAGAVLPSKDFENVRNIANRVYDRHCSSAVGFLGRPSPDESGMTALTA